MSCYFQTFFSFYILNQSESWSVNSEAYVDNNVVYKCLWMGFPHSSVGKESACTAGDPSLIPGLGKSAGEGIG